VDISSTTDWYGTDTITFRARDPAGAIAEDTIIVIVKPINDPPIIEGVPETFVVHYDADYSFNLMPYISDKDDPMEKLFLILNDRHIRTDPISNMNIIMNYPKRMVGMEVSVRLIVSDGIDSGYQDILVSVTDNWPPELIKELPDISFYEDEGVKNIFNLNEFFTDKDSNTLYFSYGQKFINIEIHTDGMVDISAQPNWNGVEVITFRATDFTEAFKESIIVVTVIPVNDPPEIEMLPRLTGVVKELIKFDLSDFITDVDNNITELSIIVKSAKIDVVTSGRELVIYSDVSGIENITIIISDGIAETSTNMLIELTEENLDDKVGDDFLMSILWLLILVMLIIISIMSFAYYRKYVGNYYIEDIFWIHNDGTLILHESFSNKTTNQNKSKHQVDDDILSGMFTGIISFTQDAFSEEEETGKKTSIKEIQMDDKNIMVEKGKYTYFAMLFSGRSGKILYNKSRRVLQNIEKKYEKRLAKWDGVVNPYNSARRVVRLLAK
jgi:hypothetical protein